MSGNEVQKQPTPDAVKEGEAKPAAASNASLGGGTLREVRDANVVIEKPGEVQPLTIVGASTKKIEAASKKTEAAPTKAEEAENKKMDAKIKSVFVIKDELGKPIDVVGKLKEKDHDWLIAHKAELRRGFNSLFDNNHDMTVGQIAGRMNKLSDGLIYSSISGPDYKVFLHRTGLYPDDQLFHEYTKNSGPGSDRVQRK